MGTGKAYRRRSEAWAASRLATRSGNSTRQKQQMNSEREFLNMKNGMTLLPYYISLCKAPCKSRNWCWISTVESLGLSSRAKRTICSGQWRFSKTSKKSALRLLKIGTKSTSRTKKNHKKRWKSHNICNNTVENAPDPN